MNVTLLSISYSVINDGNNNVNIIKLYVFYRLYGYNLKFGACWYPVNGTSLFSDLPDCLRAYRSLVFIYVCFKLALFYK